MPTTLLTGKVSLRIHFPSKKVPDCDDYRTYVTNPGTTRLHYTSSPFLRQKPWGRVCMEAMSETSIRTIFHQELGLGFSVRLFLCFSSESAIRKYNRDKRKGKRKPLDPCTVWITQRNYKLTVFTKANKSQFKKVF